MTILTEPIELHPESGATPMTSQRLLAARAPDLATHIARVGPLPMLGDPAALRAAVRAAGLTGHGGAAFPTWRKLEAVAAGRNPVVIGNAAEGEPASRKDQLLVRQAPHLVLDGLQLAARAVGATSAYLYLHASAETERAACAGSAVRPVAGRDRPGAGVVRVRAGVGGRGRRRGRPAGPPRCAGTRCPAGRSGPPDPGAERRDPGPPGPDRPPWTPTGSGRSGSANQPGTFLATVSGAVRRPGVLEAAYGTPLGELIAGAGGATEPLRAVLVGGYHGVWLPAEALSAPMSVEGLAPWGATPGAGVVVALGRSESGIAATARIAAYLAGEGAQQCGPCLNGLPAMATVLGRMAGGDGRPDLPQQVEWLTRVVEGRGACHHPDGTARMIRSALAVFAR